MLNIAILYTGQMRTMKKTLPYLKQNILLNDRVHVFAVVQRDTIEDPKSLLEEQIGNHLKSFVSFIPNDPCFVAIRNNLLDTMNINQEWREFLTYGGSMIEYYQMYLAYLEMVKYERTHHSDMSLRDPSACEPLQCLKYDFVIRMRTDIVLSIKMDFNWLDLTNDELDRRYRVISLRKNLRDPKIINALLMNTLINWGRLDYIENPDGSTYSYAVEKITNDYLRNGRYIIAIQTNAVFIINRRDFSSISCIGLLYGTFSNENVVQWFNAENQLMNMCLNVGLNIFNSNTLYERVSGLRFQPETYLNQEGDLINTDRYNFFVMRF